MYREQLRDTRAQIASLMSDKKSLEHDIAEMEKKFALVSDVLKAEDRQKLPFLNDKTGQEPNLAQRRPHKTRNAIPRTSQRVIILQITKHDYDHRSTSGSSSSQASQ
ncbi:unnamed protein product [Gongylonema pulchrum]|uniref:PKcGMP_CC domain-containing protein n=1 Tax=Gongylonema pulchrum TaxID=637853 RepID=A0A183E6Y1_9BILA|nr:unnamed protein product [Gongylonema pulchrum]